MSIVKAAMSQWQRALQILAFIETGFDLAWISELSEVEVKQRVKVLVLLLDLLPRSELHLLDKLVMAIATEFPSESRPTAMQVRDLRYHLASSMPWLTQQARRPTMDVDEVARHELDDFLNGWNMEVLGDPDWAYLPSAVPGESPVPVDDIYVELFAIGESDKPSRAEVEPIRHRAVHSKIPIVSLEAMLACQILI